ncbi:MAG: ABC transporter ATP-binding protein [Anaerolineae bacterium]|nr:ABC transporter ATP-binding protein [Anaerolineae bacterium]
MQNRRAPAWRNLMYLGYLLTDQSFVKEIKIFGLAQTLLGRYKQLYRQFYEENRGLALRRSLGNGGLQILALLAHFGGYLAVILRTAAGYLTLGDLTMYSAILTQAQATAGAIMFGLADLYEQNLFINNLFTFLGLQPHIPSNGGGKPIPEALRTGIQMQNVTFHYPGVDEPVLREINLKIAPGEKIALVGENGAGKTTLIKLLARLYDPTEGTITFDDMDLREVNVASLHHQIGVIFQDFVRYPCSGRENIGFGQVEALGDDERIQASARKSGAHEVLANLPNSYDTVLGRRFDDQGPDLSYGQWQKIALARAYMRDAPVLILDEPTASLDAKSEYEVFKHFKELAKERTVILSSHRFSTVRMADRIIVLDDGRIVEEGSHEELMNAGALYAAMFNMQAEGYR